MAHGFGSEGPPHAHSVQLYEADEHLIGAVTDFIEEGLVAGEAGLVIATPQHAAAIGDNLRCRGIDLDVALLDGSYLVLDAAETIDRLSRGGTPRPDRFRTVIGKAVEKMQPSGKGVRAFGEMVALLWTAGDVAGALRLEELWNDLTTTHPFKLICGYPLNAFDDDRSGAFHDVCALHERVVPTESYVTLPDDGDRLRVVSALQQRVSASVKERANREAERQYRQALELNDALVQGLSAAKMALELKDYDTLDDVLSETLGRASAIVSDLLGSHVRTEGLVPGDLRR